MANDQAAAPTTSGLEPDHAPPPPADPTPPRRTAAEFALDLDGYGGPGLVAREGWRGLVAALSGGLVTPGPSRRERRDRALLTMVATPLSSQRRILFCCCKGGVGKTTLCALTGHLLARVRGDHVVALDCNPDAGSLATRIPRQTSRTITDLLRDAEDITTYARLRDYTSQATSRLEVIASNSDPRAARALTGADYQRAIRLVERFHNLVLLDAGTGLLDPATQGILEVADQLVIPLSPSSDETLVAAQTLDWLDSHGREDLVRGAVAVINQASGSEPAQIREHFAARCAAVVRVPWDPYLARGGDTDLEALAPATQHAVLEVAAAVAGQFNRPRAHPRPLQEQP